MSKTTLIIFWVIWLLDVRFALYGFWEFIGGVFGRYAAPTSKYITMWIGLLAFALLILGGSLFFKNSGQNTLAMGTVALPLVFAAPYGLWLLAMIIGGSKTNWR